MMKYKIWFRNGRSKDFHCQLQVTERPSCTMLWLTRWVLHTITTVAYVVEWTCCQDTTSVRTVTIRILEGRGVRWDGRKGGRGASLSLRFTDKVSFTIKVLTNFPSIYRQVTFFLTKSLLFFFQKSGVGCVHTPPHPTPHTHTPRMGRPWRLVYCEYTKSEV